MDNYSKLISDNYEKILDETLDMLMDSNSGEDKLVLLRKTGEVAFARELPRRVENWIDIGSVTLYKKDESLSEYDEAEAQETHAYSELEKLEDELRGMINELW